MVAAHPSPLIAPFKANVANWGVEYTARAPRHLRASDLLAGCAAIASDQHRSLVELLIENRHLLHWEQSYNKSQHLVSDHMLENYGFVEIIGKLGPFLSDHVRLGIGVWGADVDYPRHRHQAEEIYLPLAGGAIFNQGEDGDITTFERVAGEPVFTPSMVTHGYHTKGQPMVVFYIWQHGDMREISDFS